MADLPLAFRPRGGQGASVRAPGFSDAPTRNMWPHALPVLLGDPAEWLGDWHPLVDQLGSANGLFALGEVSASLRVPVVRNLSGLRHFLREYQKHLLVPHELPAIQRAFDHTCRHELRELVALDQQLGGEPALKFFATASRRAGQTQLLKLRPLRDERLPRRYREAVERGDASGWHTLVYGLTLALYSLPLRQGLLGFGYQTTRGFIHAAARSLRLSEHDCRELLQELCEPLPNAIEALIVLRAAA